MSTTGEDLPEGWSRADDTEAQAGQYSAQRPIRYEHADGIGVNVQPTAPDIGDTDQDVWQVDAVREEGRGAVESLREGVEGRDTAIETAREFMETYNQHRDSGDSGAGGDGSDAGNGSAADDAIAAFTE